MLQSATATVTAGPSILQVLGVTTAVMTLVLGVCAACVYAYKLGVLKRDGEATRADAVRSNEALTSEVRNGFKTVHRRMDRFDEFTRGVQETDVETSAWRAEFHGRLSRVEGDVEELEPRVRSLEERKGQ